MNRNDLINKANEIAVKLPTLEGDALKHAHAELADIAKGIKEADANSARDALLAHNKEVADRDLWKEVDKYMRGETLGDSARDALSIRESKIRDAAGEFAIRIPGNATVWFSSRSSINPVTSTMTAGPANMWQTSLDGVLPILAVPTPLFDKASKIMAVNGTAIPVVAQTAADPFAGVTVTDVTEGDDKTETAAPSVDQTSITTQETAAYFTMTDKAIRRTPNFPDIAVAIMRNALAYNIEGKIVTALKAKSGVKEVNRAVNSQVSWADFVNLEEGVPYWAAVNGEYGMSQTVRAYVKSLIGSSTGYPLFGNTTANGPYVTINGKGYFVTAFDALSATTGDVFYGDFSGVYLGIGQDIAIRRTGEGLTLLKANSQAFAVFADVGIGIPRPFQFSKLVAH